MLSRVHASFSHFGPLSVSREGRRSFAPTQPLTYFSFFCLLSSSPPCITVHLHFPPFFIPSFLLLPPSLHLLSHKHTAPLLFFQGAAEFGASTAALHGEMATAPSSGAKERRGGEETARPMEENRRGGGDRRRFASHPMSTPGPKAARLASRREFTKTRTDGLVVHFGGERG